MTRFTVAVWTIAMTLSACGMQAKWSEPGIYQCNDGRRIATDEWTPYVGTDSWIENKKTGEQLHLQPPLRCWKESK